MTTVFVLNGPNLGRLGSREPDVYGGGTLVDLQAELEAHADALPNAASVTLDFRQTDSETELISWLHEAVDAGAPVIMNPAAFTHYSYALRDAAALVSSAGLPLIEVHIIEPARQGRVPPHERDLGCGHRGHRRFRLRLLYLGLDPIAGVAVIPNVFLVGLARFCSLTETDYAWLLPLTSRTASFSTWTADSGPSSSSSTSSRARAERSSAPR